MDDRVLVALPSGKKVWMLPGQIRTSTGASNLQSGNRWADIAKLPVPGGGAVSQPARRTLRAAEAEHVAMLEAEIAALKTGRRRASRVA